MEGVGGVKGVGTWIDIYSKKKKKIASFLFSYTHEKRKGLLL